MFLCSEEYKWLLISNGFWCQALDYHAPKDSQHIVFKQNYQKLFYYGKYIVIRL